jgi:hypothetical protein
MQREEALRVAGVATRADIRLLGHERQLGASLMSLLPDDVDVAVGSPIEDRPGVWAVAGGSLYEVVAGTYVAAPATDRATEITCSRRTLDPAKATVSVRERVGPRVGGGIVRERRWEFRLAADEEPIVLESEQTMRGGFEAERAVPPAEQLARALARALGFGVPEEDVGQGEY